ncbi:MAG: Fructokinase [Candidatus Accumulibacter adjunctus]|uniref:Fructokinase n=1 Tax=Candidatus Accumulibacter adjunctus TaxID=1454001 RepID=A0A011PT74_9PROT|nr:MAG: Fructokinase [Candidatus Accumulibacter adjunctus]
MRLGVDLGGSKIELVALDDGGQVLLRRRRPTPGGSYHGTLVAIGELVAAAERDLGQRGSVGVGMPGAESAVDGKIKNANSTWLIGHALRKDLQDLLQREVRLANDANCFALSEATDGAAEGAETVFGVILGTGVGGGLVVRGRVLTGANRIAGEWGHNALPLPHEEEQPPPRCYCGRLGCIETWLSGPALAADHLRHTGVALTAVEISSRASSGDAACEATLQRYERRLAKALAMVVNIVDPDSIVLGGGLSNIDRFYRSVPRLWHRHVFSDVVQTRLLRNRHGDSSGVRGAAWLWRAD